MSVSAEYGTCYFYSNLRFNTNLKSMYGVALVLQMHHANV